MVNTCYDERAVKILFATYWSATGWKKQRTVTPEDFAFAKARGVMFDAGTLAHDEMARAARAQAEEVGHDAVAEAFLRSLGGRDLAYRSALGSFAASRWLPDHDYREGRFAHCCRVCGDARKHENLDLSVLSFERLKWGGVRHLHPYYAAFDLAEFRKLPPPRATAEDGALLRRVLDIAASQPADARPGDLEKAIAGVFPSNTEERRVVLDLLGYCGILQPAGHPGFFNGYARMDDRAQPAGKNDWSFPVLWWRGRDGVNSIALKFYFGSV